jgi:hypothetical protein
MSNKNLKIIFIKITPKGISVLALLFFLLLALLAATLISVELRAKYFFENLILSGIVPSSNKPDDLAAKLTSTTEVYADRGMFAEKQPNGKYLIIATAKYSSEF